MSTRSSGVTGYSQAEVIGANPFCILKSGQTSRKRYRQLWQTITDGGEWHGNSAISLDGALYWESATIAPIRDEQGITTHFVAIRGHHQRKENPSGAARQRLKYHGVFATVGDALFLVDNKTAASCRSNPATCKLYGYTREEFLGMRDTDLSVATETTPGSCRA